MNDELFSDFMSIPWFERIGVNDFRDLNVTVVKSYEEMEKSFLGTKWGNTCLTANGDISVFLLKNKPDIYEKWNYNSNEIRSKYIPLVKEEFCCKLQKDPNDKLIRFLMCNIIDLLIYLTYKEYYESPFFESLIAVYKSGHIPCGWDGTYPKGKLKVY